MAGDPPVCFFLCSWCEISSDADCLRSCIPVSFCRTTQLLICTFKSHGEATFPLGMVLMHSAVKRHTERLRTFRLCSQPRTPINTIQTQKSFINYTSNALKPVYTLPQP